MARPSHKIAPARVRGIRTFSAFENHSYRLLWGSNFFSYISRWMQIVLLGWLILVLTDSPWLVALVGFFGMVPMLVLGVLGGVLADRLNRQHLLISTQSANFLAGLAMTVLLFTGLVQYWHAYIVLLVSGTGWALDMPSRRSVLLDLLGRTGVTNAVALDSVGMQASKMLGPALAGLLITLVDVKGGYVVVTLLYLSSVLLMSLASLPRKRGAPAARNVFRNLVEGFQYVRSNNTIMAVVLITILMNLLLFPYQQMIPVIARDVLGVGPGLMGLLSAADGLGALVGAVMIASASRMSHHGRVYLGGSMLALVMLLLLAFSSWYALSLPILLVLGLGSAGFGTMQGTIVMLAAKEDMRGRALGVITLAIGAGPLGALMVGAVADTMGPQFAIGMNAVLGLLLVGTVGLMMSSLRQRITDVEPAPASVQAEPQNIAPRAS